MSIAPHTGIVDFGTFTAPTASTDGIQGEVPQPLAGQEGYVLTGTGWASAGSVGLVGYQGTWNALTNTPTLTSSVGTQGYYYVVNVAGTTNLNGITDWQVGDWAIFNGSVWQKVDNTDSYDPANVAITGGTINNTTIGATTPNTGVFTTLTATGQTDLGGPVGNPVLKVFGSTPIQFIDVEGSTTGTTRLRSWSTNASSSSLLFQTRATGNFTFATGGSPGNVQAFIAHTTSAVNYVQVTGAATGGQPTISAQGSDTNIDLNLTAKGTGVLNLNTGAGTQVRIIDSGGTAVNRIHLQGQGTGFLPVIASRGSDTNLGMSYSTQGTGGHDFYTAGTNFTQQIKIAHTTSAVNYVQVTGAATTASPIISAQGSDTNISFQMRSKGTGDINLMTSSGTNQVVIRNNSSAVNFISLSGSATGFAERIYAEGSDTNIPIAFQSKGAGAIDLAAGSSGVNISNGGTVTAITRTASGTAYTSAPSVAITAPTTAGGVQATATCTLGFTNPVITNGGTGYTVNDVLSVVGGTSTTTAQLTVTSVSGGVITGVSILNAGVYSVAPSNPSSVTGGTGSSATFTLDWVVRTTFTITNAGSGYVEQPTVTFSGGGGSGAAAYATVGSGTVVKSIGTTLDFYTANAGIGFRISDSLGTGTNYWSTGSGYTSPYLWARGSTNTNGNITSNGTGFLSLQTNGGSNEQLRVSHTASAVNYVQVTGAATGLSPVISAQGSDANIQIQLQAKGTGLVRLATGGGLQAYVSDTASSVNYVGFTGGATNFGPQVFATGSDTNIPLVLQPKGTGALQAQQTDSTATGGNARGANAVDWQTTRSGAAYVASGAQSVVGGGQNNIATATASLVGGGVYNYAGASYSAIPGGFNNNAGGAYSFIGSGNTNNSAGWYSSIVGGLLNSSQGYLNFIGGGSNNSANALSAVTTQSGTMNGTTSVTLSASNANIKVGQLITGTSIVIGSNTTPFTYVAAISGTSLTLSQAASGSSTSTLSFYTPHGVVVGGGNNQATGSYSFIGGGGDAGTAANRNVASGDWSVVAGGFKNTASGLGATVCGGGWYAPTLSFPNTASGEGSFIGGGSGNQSSNRNSTIAGGYGHTASGSLSFIGGGFQNIASGPGSVIVGGTQITTRGLNGIQSYGSGQFSTQGDAQVGLLVIRRSTTDATPTILTSDGGAAGTINQVILPNNSAYYFKGTVIANVTGGGNTKGWTIEGAIKRGANAASTALVGTPTVVSAYADTGAATWAITATADTTNGGLAITFTGQAATTIRVVAKLETTEVTF